MSNSELMPCPFCGDTDVQVEPYGNAIHHYQARCLGCRAGGPVDFRDDVVAAWNRRVSQPAASQGPDERNMFELWALSQIYTTTEVLAGLRTTSGYWDETATGAEANRLWKLWSSIRAAAHSPTSESKGVERG